MADSVPVYVTSFNLLTWLQAACARIARMPGARVVVVDNASSYEPLLDWYRDCPYPVYRCHENLGPHAAWRSGAVWDWKGSDRYAVTDPDLDLDDVPADALARLAEAFDRWPTVRAAGLSLRTDDVPADFAYRDEAREWEAQYQTERLGHGFFNAVPGGRTFALYDRRRPRSGSGGPVTEVRAEAPYAARHRPWYLNTADLPAEYLQYAKKARPKYTRWTRLIHDRAVYDM